MKKQWLILACLMTITLPIFAEVDVEMGVRIGGELTDSTIGYYTEFGRFRYPSRSGAMDIKQTSFSFTGGMFTDIIFADNAIISVLGTFSLYRNYELKLGDALTGDLRTQKMHYHNFGLDILYKGRVLLNDYVYLFGAAGLGFTVNTIPGQLVLFEDGRIEKQLIASMHKPHMGLNLIGEMGFTVLLAETHFLHLGARVTADLITYTHRARVPVEGINHQTVITPFTVGAYLGYSFLL